MAHSWERVTCGLPSGSSKPGGSADVIRFCFGVIEEVRGVVVHAVAGGSPRAVWAVAAVAEEVVSASSAKARNKPNEKGIPVRSARERVRKNGN